MQATKKIEIKDISIPQINDNEILVKIASSGLCHSDLMMLDGTYPGTSNPVVLGHEGVGYVEEFGANVKGFKSGDRIGFLPVKDCCCESANVP